jgi:hypothetical protein
MLPASVLILIIVFGLLFVGVISYMILLSIRLKRLRDDLDQVDENPKKDKNNDV